LGQYFSKRAAISTTAAAADEHVIQ
jgi:hypothetical protein